MAETPTQCSIDAEIVEQSFGWMSRFRRLLRDYERLAQTLAGFHPVAFAMLMVKQFVELRFQSA